MHLIVVASVTLAFALTGMSPAQSGQRRGPPPEAIQACASATDGDACSFDGPRGLVEGTCWRPDESKPLACRPAGPPPRGPNQG